MKYILLMLLPIIVFIISCNINQDSDVEASSIIYLKLNNKDVESAIIEYQTKMVKDNVSEIVKSDSVYVGVCMRDINDSVKRFVIFPIIDYDDISFITPFVICRVNGKDVFFRMDAGQSYYYSNDNYFKLPEKINMELIERYFPKRFNEYLQKGYFSNKCIYHPELCHLTFLKDSLIDKTYQRGSSRDKVVIKINGKEEWY